MPGSIWLQLPSEGVGRNSKGAVVIIRMVVPPLSSGLEATIVHHWFPIPRSAHTLTHTHGAQFPCNADNRDHTFLPGRPSSPCGWKRQVSGGCFGREVLEAEGLVGLMAGHAHVAWPLTVPLLRQWAKPKYTGGMSHLQQQTRPHGAHPRALRQN